MEAKVVCELNGNHGNDIDRVTAEDELFLVRHYARMNFERLPENLREIYGKVTFVINHSNPATKIVGGWSAEDDPEYRYPDVNFYPEGTIKVNFSEKLIQFLQFTYWVLELHPENSGMAAGANEFILAYILHELKHAEQYHLKPVRSLSTIRGSCKDGLCDKNILEETKQKIAYEKEALLLGCNTFTSEGLAALDKVQDYIDRYPNDFSVLGPFNLLGKDFVRYYLSSIKPIIAAQDFAGGAKTMYEGQWVLPELVWKLMELNDRRKNDSFPEYSELVAETVSKWRGYINTGTDYEKLLNFYPYIRDVEKRFYKEIGKAYAYYPEYAASLVN